MIECQLCGMQVKPQFSRNSKCPAWPSVRQGFGGSQYSEFHVWKKAPVGPPVVWHTTPTTDLQVADLTRERDQALRDLDAANDRISDLEAQVDVLNYRLIAEDLGRLMAKVPRPNQECRWHPGWFLSKAGQCGYYQSAEYRRKQEEKYPRP